MSGQISSPEGASPKEPTQPISIGSSSGSPSSAESGFAAMLGPSATPEQVQKAMMQAVNFIITDLKREEKQAKKAAKHMKDVIEGKEDQ